MSSLYLRGADPSHVAVYVDGVLQSNELSSRGDSVDLSTISLWSVESITVLTGPGLLRSQGALVAAIYIGTRSEESSRFRVTAGQAGRADALYSHHAGSWKGLGAWSADGHGGMRGRTMSRDLALVSTLGPSTFRARFSSGTEEGAPDDSGGELYSVMRAPATLDWSRLEGVARHVMSNGVAVGVTLSEVDTRAASPGVAPGIRDPFGVPPSFDESELVRAELIAEKSIDRSQVTFETSVGASLTDGDSSGFVDAGQRIPIDFDFRRNVLWGFFGARYEAGEFSARGALRLESTDGQTYVLPAVGATLQSSAGQFAFSVSKTRKEPSFYALGNPLVGDPNLSAEEASLAEVGFRGDWSTGSLRVSVFRNSYRNLVDFEPGPPPRLVNRRSASSVGTELYAVRSFDNGWSLSSSATLMDVSADRAELRHRPRWTTSLDLSGPMRDGLDASLTLQGVGERSDSSIPTGPRKLGAFALLGASLTWARGRSQWSLVLENATDRRYEEFVGGEGVGRRVVLSSSYEF